MATFEISSAAFKGEFHRDMSPARLLLTSTGATPTIADQDELIEFLTRIVQLQVRFVAIYDLRVIGLPSASLLKGLGEWCKANQKDFEPLQIAISIVLKNSIWSGAIKKLIGIITAICPPVCPLEFGYSLEAAESFLAKQCSITEAEVANDAVSKDLSFKRATSCDVDCEAEPMPSQPRRLADLRLLQKSQSRASKENLNSNTDDCRHTDSSTTGRRADALLKSHDSFSQGSQDVAEFSTEEKLTRKCGGSGMPHDSAVHCLAQARGTRRQRGSQGTSCKRVRFQSDMISREL